jgi:hypothetical protein
MSVDKEHRVQMQNVLIAKTASTKNQIPFLAHHVVTLQLATAESTSASRGHRAQTQNAVIVHWASTKNQIPLLAHYATPTCVRATKPWLGKQENHQPLVLTAQHTTLENVLDVLLAKCCSQTKAASNALRDRHPLALQPLAWIAMPADIKVRLLPPYMAVQHVELVHMVFQQARALNPLHVPSVQKVVGHPPMGLA